MGDHNSDEMFYSIDIETNGLCPGINSMLSLGAVAFNPYTGEMPTLFQMNLLPLSDTIEDVDTMNWWKQFPEAYKQATTDAGDPKQIIESFVFWVNASSEGKKKVACYWKPEFDGAFVRYYLFRFTGQHIFGRSGSGLDIKTTTALALGQKYSETQIANVPRNWCGKISEHNHNALDDAIEQAHVYMNAIKKLNVYTDK